MGPVLNSIPLFLPKKWIFYEKNLYIILRLVLGIREIYKWTCNAGNEVDDWEIPLALGCPNVDAMIQAPGKETQIEFVLNREGSDFKDVFGIGPVCQSQSRSGRESKK